MGDLVKSGGKGGALSRALARYRQSQETVHLGFLIDATGSRAAAWEQAQAHQRRLFDAAARFGKIAVRLVHFGGGQVTDRGEKEGARDLAAAMAPVRCISGMTQIIESLNLFLLTPGARRPRAVILIGDAFEEGEQDAANMAALLKRAGIKVFCFLEGEDAHAATVFRRLAEGTGGVFAKLGADLSLGDLCEGVALLSVGGEKALRRLGNPRARQLLLTGPTDTKGPRR